MQRTLAVFSWLAAATGATGCSSSSSSAAPSCPTAEVSFANDVMPVIQANCTATTACHGQMNNRSEENLYLGASTGTPAAAAVYPLIVGVKAQENPSMNLVTPGSTANSFLWHKLQSMDDLQALASQCSKAPTMCLDCNAASPCGDVMPYLTETLSITDPAGVCTIQNWIQNGAKNN